MKLLIFVTLLAGTLAAPVSQSLSVHDDGSYQFFYETGKDAGQHTRTEVRHPDGVVIGKFSYEDPNGEIREVSYRADDSGYVANGDVSVEGAPKGQFPLIPEEEQNDNPPLETSTHSEDPEPQESAPENSNSDDPDKSEEAKQNGKNSEAKEDDLKDLTLDEPSVDEPPEAFPPGFFTQNFHGLRRLPEPTTEDKSTTSDSPVEANSNESSSEQDNSTQPDEQPTESTDKSNELFKLNEKIANEMEVFMHLRPFQSFSPQQMDTSMFRQPVYVFSYQHPDSYGYHYFF